MRISKRTTLITAGLYWMTILTTFAHSEVFKSAFVDKLLTPYLELQTALAADNLSGAKSGATAYIKVFKRANLSESNGEEKALLDPALSIASAIRIEDARLSFAILSKEFLSLVDQVGLTEDFSLYAVYCPKFSDDKGAKAVWLQKDEKIMNPYLGSKMLDCGVIDKQIRKE